MSPEPCVTFSVSPNTSSSEKKIFGYSRVLYSALYILENGFFYSRLSIGEEGKGEFGGLQANLRAFVTAIAPTLYGALYRTGVAAVSPRKITVALS